MPVSRLQPTTQLSSMVRRSASEQGMSASRSSRRACVCAFRPISVDVSGWLWLPKKPAPWVEVELMGMRKRASSMTKLSIARDGRWRGLLVAAS